MLRRQLRALVNLVPNNSNNSGRRRKTKLILPVRKPDISRP